MLAPFYDLFFIGLIILSTINLALDNPLNDPESTLAHITQWLDFVLSCFFIVEAMTKILVFGFLFNGKDSYLRSSWNVIDFTIVLLIIVGFCIPQSTTLNVVKVSRLFRVLRPLRLI